MQTIHRWKQVWLFTFAAVLIGVQIATPLTVENISLQRLTKESALIVRGTVLSSHSQWEGKNINTYITLRVEDAVKGKIENTITVKQFGGKVGDIAEEISGTPKLLLGEDVVLFLVNWNGHYWIHSIVLGKFSVQMVQGQKMAVNDLNNIGLIDPVTKREITEPNQKMNSFPLESFLNEIRSFSKK